MARPTTVAGSAADFMPPTRSLSALRETAAGCRGCELWKRSTQTVFGAGPRRASCSWASSPATRRISRHEATARFVDDLAKIPVFLSRHRAA